MFDKGRIVIDLQGENKRQLTVEKLLGMFENLNDFDEFDDKLLLS
jgi:putative ABC transport system ATP-binding protein